MMKLNLLFFVKKACPRTTCRAVFYTYLPHFGDVGQESEPWAKEANPLCSQRPYKAGYGGAFTRETGCGHARGPDEPVSRMEWGHHAWPGDVGVCRRIGHLILPLVNCITCTLPPAWSDL